MSKVLCSQDADLSMLGDQCKDSVQVTSKLASRPVLNESKSRHFPSKRAVKRKQELRRGRKESNVIKEPVTYLTADLDSDLSRMAHTEPASKTGGYSPSVARGFRRFRSVPLTQGRSMDSGGQLKEDPCRKRAKRCDQRPCTPDVDEEDTKSNHNESHALDEWNGQEKENEKALLSSTSSRSTLEHLTGGMPLTPVPSSPLSSLESTPSPPEFLSQDLLSDNPDEETSVPQPNDIVRREAQGVPQTNFSPQTLSRVKILQTEQPEGLSDLLIPPTRPRLTKKVSPFFPKRPAERVSCIPFPPLNGVSFGLVQERLCHDPFRLLVAVTFLNKTRGKVAMPICYKLFDRYPNPEDFANADQSEVCEMIHPLGLQNARAVRLIKVAKAWLETPPQKGRRYVKLHYPTKGDGKDICKYENPITDEDPRMAWEIAHLPGTGAYALDSWRIFCRDELRGLPTGIPELLTPQSVEEELKKEWTKVLPLDKELRAYLRWRWLRLGWQWDPVTGNRVHLNASELKMLQNGGVSYEGDTHSSVEG